AGREAAELVSLSLGIQTEVTSPISPVPSVSTVVQLVPLQESSLPLVATVLTLTLTVSAEDLSLGLSETEATSGSASAFELGTGVSVGQGVASPSRGGQWGSEAAEPSEESGAGVAAAVPTAISAWERLVIGLEEALERFQREHPGGLSGALNRTDRS